MSAENVAINISTEATKRPREDDTLASASPITEESGNQAGRPPPLKFATSEGASEPKAPAPMVRIKSRASLSSPTTPALGVPGLKINSPTIVPPAPATPANGLKILSPLTRSPTAGSVSGARFGSPTDSRTNKSPQRYSSFTSSMRTASAANSSIAQDPKARYSVLFGRLVGPEAGARVADSILKVSEAVRTERVKSLLHHLNDDKNLQLRADVTSGEISADDFVNMDIRKLINPEKQAAVRDKQHWSEKDRDLKELDQAQKISSTLFECPKCKKRDCTFYEKQTRSADEPMTQFFTCNLCKYKWKIY